MRSDALARRNRIITAAIELFRRHGHSVPLESIAAEAGVGIATLYRNFPDRQALTTACGQKVFSSAISLQQQVLQAWDSNPVGQWTYYTGALVEMGVGLMISAFAPADTPELPSELAILNVEADALGNKILSKAKAEGLVNVDINHATYFLGLVTVSRPPAPGVALIEPHLTELMVTLYLAGLARGVEGLDDCFATFDR